MSDTPTDTTGPLGLDALLERHGSAKHPERDAVHPAPDGVPDALVDAVGQLSAALETAAVARGHLYAFHRFSGTADREVQEAVSAFRDAGRDDIADVLDQVLVGRDALRDMWSFQIVEGYDAQYWTAFRDAELAARHAAGLTEPHVLEASMKHREQGGAG